MADLKINFWKLRIHVDRSDEICVHMTKSMWELGDNNVWHRKTSPTTRLGYQVWRFDSDKELFVANNYKAAEVGGNIDVQDHAIVFSNQHFLKIIGVVPPETPKNLVSPEQVTSVQSLNSKMPKIEDVDQASKKVKLLSGRNIHVETTFSATQGILAKGQTKKQPLFYLEQGPEENGKKYVLSFGEEHTATVTEDDGNGGTKTENIRQIYWKISGDEQVNTGDFRLCEPAKYTLTISQDFDRFREPDDEEPPYFEFFADAVPLPMRAPEGGKDFKKVHPFEPTERLVYIGYEPGSSDTFEGSIESLIFDPNSSCDNC
jgi:hypothetical protein